MNPPPSTEQALREENAGLRERLAQAEETLAAIRHGEVDALVVESAAGPQVYTLQGPDAKQNRFRGEILAQLSEAVIALDHDQRLIYANAAAERRYDFTASRMLGRPLTEIYQREWPRPGAEAEMMETLSASGAWTGELTHITHGGARIEVEISVTVIRDSAGVAAGLLAVSRDVTGCKRMERELAAKERRFRALLENSAENVILLDAAGRIVYESPHRVNLLGFAPGEMTGRECFELVHPEDLDAARRDLGGMLVARPGTHVTGEIRMRRKDGGWSWIHYHGGNLLHDPAVEALVLNLRDITARKQVEDTLREQQRLHKSVTDNATLALFIMDHNQHCVFMNPAAVQLTGFTLEEVQGRPLHDVIHHTHQDGAPYPLRECPIDRAFPKNERTQGEEVFVHKDGHFYPVAFTASPLRNANGRPVGTIIEVHDITERKRAEEALRRSAQFPEENPNPVLRVAGDGGLLYANGPARQWLATWGWQADAPLPAPVQAVVTEAAAQHRPIEREVSASDGTTHSVTATQPSGEEYVNLYGRDVTARKQAEEALRTTEERFRLAAAATHAMVYDLNMVTLRVNAMDGLRELLGYEAGKAEMTLDWWDQCIHPDDLAKCRAAFERMRAAGCGRFLEYRLRHKDGRTLVVEDNATPLCDAAGQLVRVVGTVVDITARKQAEAKLAAAHRQTQSLIDNTTAMVYVCDLEERFVMVNAALAALLETKPAQLIGRRRHEFMPRADADAHEATDRIVIAAGQAEEFEERSDLPGRSITWLSTKFPLRDEQGRICAVAGIVTDITERKRAEDALRESEEKYRNLFENMAEEVHLWQLVRDDAGNIQTWRLVDANPPALKSWGRQSVEEIRGLTTDEIFGPGATEHYLSVVEIIMSKGVAHTFENYFPHLDKHFRFTSVPFGEFFITTGADITAIKKSEAALRQSREDLNRAQEVGQLGSWRLDVARNLLTWSDENHRIFGVPQGTPLTYETFLGIVHPEDRAYVDAQWNAALRGEPYDIEHRILVDGQVKWVREKAYLELDGTGGLSGGFGITQDITTRKRTEEELRESLREIGVLRTAMDEHSIVAITDPQGRITFANDRFCATSKYTREELIGSDHRIVNSGHHPKEFIRGLWTTISRGHVWHGEIKNRAKDGSYYWVATTIMPFLDDQGQPRQYVAIRTNITEHKLAEEALRESFSKIEKAEDELRKLNETLEERVLERTAEVRKLADRLRALTSELTLSEHRERKRLAQLLHDGLQQILVASRFRLAALSHAQDLDVRKCAQEVCDLLSESMKLSRSLTADLSPPILHEFGLVPALEWLTRSMLDKQGLEVELEIHAEVAPSAEELNILLFQAARELLFNIVKHAGVMTARVGVAKRDKMIELTVSDQGAGFDPEQLLKHDGNSGGFGLFSIRERLELLGGSLEVQSAPGRGSRFVLLTPLPDSARPPTVPPKQPRKVPATHASHATGGRSEVGKIRVMLVDDHQVMRQGLGALIRAERDLDVVGEAADGESAVRLAREIHPDVILVDVNMPRMHGPEATRIIHAEFPEIQIIGLSMFEATERAEAMREAGAVNYLVKSGPAHELIAAIRACMHRDPSRTS